MPEPWNVGWLNQNALRRYPLLDGVTAKDVTGEFRLPDDVMVDLLMTVHNWSELDPSGFHVSGVGVFQQSVVLRFGYLGTEIAALVIAVASHTTNRTYEATILSDDFHDSVLRVAIGKLDALLDQPAGNWTFDATGGRILPTLIVPDLRGVSALYLRNGSSVSAALQGDVELVAGSNTRLTVSEVDGRHQIRIDAIDGEGLNDDCECTGAEIGPCVRSINGVRPASDGNLLLLGDDCLKVAGDSGENAVKLSDECSKPCCGCAELEVLKTSILTIENKVATTEQAAERLDAVISQMQSVLLASKIIYDPNRLQDNGTGPD